MRVAQKPQTRRIGNILRFMHDLENLQRRDLEDRLANLELRQGRRDWLIQKLITQVLTEFPNSQFEMRRGQEEEIIFNITFERTGDLNKIHTLASKYKTELSEVGCTLNTYAR